MQMTEEQNGLDRQAPANDYGVRDLPLVRYYIGALCRGFTTAESGAGQYSIRIKFDSLAAMQAAHDALIYLPNSLQAARADSTEPSGYICADCKAPLRALRAPRQAPLRAGRSRAMTDLPELPSNVLHVLRRIRRCENEVAAQVVFEHALHAYAKQVREQALEEAAKLVQNYDTCGDHTQGWQDTFAERIRALKEKQ
jgi:hypothetical protein